jgi:hypothetical protein
MGESISLRELIDATSVVDVHEHHFPDVLLSREVDLLQLFRQSYAGWSPPTSSPDPIPDAPTTWEALAPFLNDSGSNSFVRNLVRAVTEIYGVADGRITKDNWRALDAAVREHHRQPGWCTEVFRRARIERLITDPYSDPLLDARKTLGSNYDSVMRINAFACGWHPDARDHNGNSAQALLHRLGLRATTMAEYLDALEQIVKGCAARNQVALKNALAYDRHLDFDAPDGKLAAEAWGNPSPSAAAKKAFGDLVVDRLCRLAGEADLPVQMHLGLAFIRGSHPLNVAGMIERHPGTRFLLMHFAYPWSRDLIAMAASYRNIWLDLTWAQLISPTHFKLSLHEAIEALPDETRMMIGGDNWHAEETYGAIRLMRQLIGEVLEEKVASGYFTVEDARRLVPKILRENAIRFFGLT